MATPDFLDLYARSSEWALGKVEGAAKDLDAQTPCDKWNVRTLMNHMLDTQNFFMGNARGAKSPGPAPDPPDLVGDDPVADFATSREEMLRTFGEAGVIEKTGPSLGVAFSDQLLHGWDLAKATGQDPTMPEGLPEAAYELIHGLLTDDQRKGILKPEVAVAADVSAQDKLLAFSGRDPSA
jgi:uncharacterized protein (TIGR03086 family)